MFIRRCFPSFLCFLAFGAHVRALDCAASADKQTCQVETDCLDGNNLRGMDQACGTLACVSGTCEFMAWVDTGSCASTNFRACGGNDALCFKGPSLLNFAGTCTGFENNECVYQWCPDDEAPPSTPECTPCEQASDCHDPDNLSGLDQTCGNLACILGKCEFVAWNEDRKCTTTNFLTCGGDDTKCTKGPSNLNFVGTCTGYENNECIYQWCPGDKVTSTNPPPQTTAPPLTGSPSASPTVTPTESPTVAPSQAPSSFPSTPLNPPPKTTAPPPLTGSPSASPTVTPTESPTVAPSQAPSSFPSAPLNLPPKTTAPPPLTGSPSASPTVAPTESPTVAPSQAPSSFPSAPPSPSPSITASSYAPSSPPPCTFGPATTLPMPGKPNELTLRQFVDSDDGTVTFEVTYEGKAWIGIGYSPKGEMLGSKAVIGLPDEGTVKLYDLQLRAPAGIIPVPGWSEIITDASITQTDTQTVMRFTRPVTQDGQVVFQAGQASMLIHAVGSSNTLGYHPGRSSSLVMFDECERGLI